MEELDAWLVLNASRLNRARQVQLVEALGGAGAVFAAGDEELRSLPGMRAEDVARLRAAERELVAADLRRQLAEVGATVVPFTAPEYPPLLRETPEPPLLLFVQGTLTRRDELAVAIVGTRGCTPYGLMLAERLAGDLARRGFTIVSGMAAGIDAAAHEGALSAGGRTIAVMATGMDITFPASHKDLRRRLGESGAVVTERPWGTPPLPEAFPIRNRIVAGMTLGTIVVEAPAKSGALITARLAGEFGREVFAVPGSVDSPLSRGCHQLIKDGAGLVEVAEDIVDGLGILLEAVPAQRPRPEVAVSGDEQAVLDALTYQPRHVDEVVSGSSLAAAQVNAALMLLEIKGLIKRFPGNTYVRL